MHPMDFRKRVIAFLAFSENRRISVTRLFFTCDVTKFECSIFDWKDGTYCNDSHPGVSSEPLIEDEEANRTVTPNCSLFIPLFFDRKDVSSNRTIYLC